MTADLVLRGTVFIALGLFGLLVASAVFIPAVLEAVKLDVQCVDLESLERLGQPRAQPDGICPTGSSEVVLSNRGSGYIAHTWFWFPASLFYFLICMLSIGIVCFGLSQYRLASSR